MLSRASIHGDAALGDEKLGHRIWQDGERVAGPTSELDEEGGGQDGQEASQWLLRDKALATLPSSPANARQGSPELLLLLAAGSLFFAIGFSTLQERVFLIPGFHFQGWMTFLMYSTYGMCALINLAILRQTHRNGRLLDYLAVSVLAMSGNYLTNWALTYLKNYTTRIVLKSCRVLPIMAFRTALVGVRYSLVQYLAGSVLVAGIALFTSGNAATASAAEFNMLGLGLMSIALVLDALTANVEERQFFRVKMACSHAEVMLFLSIFAGSEVFLVMLVTGELRPALAHATLHPETVPYIVAFSVMGYGTVSFILLIIKHFGSASAEVVKSMRKVLQVAASFLLFPKPISWRHLLGGVLVYTGLHYLHKLGVDSLGQPGAAKAGGGTAPQAPNGTGAVVAAAAAAAVTPQASP